jgi:hypothetical protein
MAGKDKNPKTPQVTLNEVLSAIRNQERNIEHMIKVQVNEKLGHLSQEFQNSNRSFSAEVKKNKIREETQHKWKSEGNGQQFVFYSEIICDFDQVLWVIEHSKIEYCKDVIVEAIKETN